MNQINQFNFFYKFCHLTFPNDVNKNFSKLEMQVGFNE